MTMKRNRNRPMNSAASWKVKMVGYPAAPAEDAPAEGEEGEEQEPVANGDEDDIMSAMSSMPSLKLNRPTMMILLKMMNNESIEGSGISA